MIVVGVTVIAAKRLSGWQRFVPLLCPLWFPVAITDNSLDSLWRHGGGIVGFGYAAVLWALLGYVVVRSDSPQHQVLNPPFSRTVK